MHIRVISILFLFAVLPPKTQAASPESPSGASVANLQTDLTPTIPTRDHIDFYTAHTLPKGGWKIGLGLDYGVTDEWMVGSDLPSLLMGLPTVTTKLQVFRQYDHSLAIGLEGTWLSLQHLAPFLPAKKYFETLDAKIIRPQLIWSHRLSERLTLHNFWTMGLGKIKARLSERGKRAYWEQKHPDEPYDTATPISTKTDHDPLGPATSSSRNQARSSEKTSALVSRRTIEAQSILGLSTDRLQITGTYTRKNGNLVLMSTRMENTKLEGLNAKSMALSIAQEWIVNNFHLRVGIGMAHITISGTDLDDEPVEDTGTTPISDISIYWLIP